MKEPEPEVSESAAKAEKWSACSDGCGHWAVYVGNETRKGWSGQGKVLVAGLSEINARMLVTRHELDVADLKQRLERAEAALRDKERLDWLSERLYFPDDHPNDRILVVVPESALPVGAITLNKQHDARVFREAIDKALAAPDQTAKE